MDFELAFPLNIVGIFLAFGLLMRLYIWPGLRTLPQDRTLKILMLPHTFRFVGLSFLFSGVSLEGCCPSGMGRFWCRDTCPHRHYRGVPAVAPRHLFRLALQPLGIDRPALCILQRNCVAHSTRVVRRRVL